MYKSGSDWDILSIFLKLNPTIKAIFEKRIILKD